MREGIAAACGATLLVLACTLLLKSLGSRAASIVACIGIIGLLSVAAGGMADIFGELGRLISDAGISKYAASVMKILAVGYLSSATSEVCSELGEAAVGRALLVAARVEIALITAPYIYEVITLGAGLFEVSV